MTLEKLLTPIQKFGKERIYKFNRYGLAGFMNAVSDKPCYLDKVECGLLIMIYLI